MSVIRQWIPLLFFGLIAAVCLFCIGRIRNPGRMERGHRIVAWVPWLHLIVSYAAAFYVRIGFGRWPRPCVDSPELPMLDGLLEAVALGLIFNFMILVPIWIGWGMLRWRRGLKAGLWKSTLVFLSGLAGMIVLQVLDPGQFWSWFWD